MNFPNFENFEKFLESVDSDLKKIFDYQKEYIFCKKGCSLCCENGDYPLSELEFEYIKMAYNKLDETTRLQIDKNVEKIKSEKKELYCCPFLINKSCSIYNHRPFVCRTFGVLTEDAKGNPAYPSCAVNGLNFSQIYDKEKKHLSADLVAKGGFKIFPKIFRLNNKVIMNLPLAKELNIDFGEAKRLIDFF